MSTRALGDTLWSSAYALALARGHEAGFREAFPGVPTPGAMAVGDESQLGDLLEAARANQRSREFKGLIDGSLRASGARGNATTQRFTPPWIARWLAENGLKARGATAPRACLDPACGGGQLLLALYDAGVGVKDLHGMDIDPLAVDVTRWSLWLRARRDSRHPALADAALRVVAPPLGTLAVAPQASFGLVVSNPPYMGSRHLDPVTRTALKRDLSPYHGDLYTAFLRRALHQSAPGGAIAFLCQHSFLFLKRYRALRKDFFARAGVREVLHLGPHAFPHIQGEKASVVAFTATVGGPASPRIIDLRDLKTPEAKELARADPERTYDGAQAASRAATGESFAYWVAPAALRRLDAGPFLGDVLDVAGSSNKTANNARFVRRWWEVAEAEIGPGKPWVRYAKGGSFRRFHGNLERVVDWTPQARAHYAEHPTANLLPERYWYREGITWSDFGGLRFSARHLPAGCVFDMAGPALFLPEGTDADLMMWLGLLNTDVVCGLLNALNPTIHYQVGDLRRLPVPADIPADARDALAQATTNAIAHMRTIDRHASPTAPDYVLPAALLHPDARLPDALALAAAWWDREWAGVLSARKQLETTAAQLYDLPPRPITAEVPRTPDFAQHARAYLAGVESGRHPETPVTIALADGLRKRRAAPLYKTPWHPSRLGGMTSP